MVNTTILTERVSLLDFVYNECPFEGCQNCEEGKCINEDVDFLHDRLDDISFAVCNSGRRIESIDDFFFDCKQVEVKENHCKWCGTKLVEEKIKVPYGESQALKPEVYCPKCD